MKTIELNIDNDVINCILKFAYPDSDLDEDIVRDFLTKHTAPAISQMIIDQAAINLLIKDKKVRQRVIELQFKSMSRLIIASHIFILNGGTLLVDEGQNNFTINFIDNEN